MRRRDSAIVLATWLAAALTSCPAAAQEPSNDRAERAASATGGPAHVRDASGNAFGYPAPLLDAQERRRFLVGNSFFKQNWVTTPSSAPDRDGLGPLFNARSCSSCHLRDGRSAPPAEGEIDRHGLLMRIGVPIAEPAAADGAGERHADAAHPAYGGQIQDVAIDGVTPEARVEIRYEPVAGTFADGDAFELLRPHYRLDDAGYGPIGTAVLGPRTAPALIGLGLLEAIPLELLERWVTEQAAHGVSGRVHWLDDGQTRRIGRFGWKATQATVAGQVAAAFANDMGITSALVPQEPLSQLQQQLLPQPTDTASEIDAETFAKVVFYTQALAVPTRRDADTPAVLAGERLFDEFGCALCHRSDAHTDDSAFHAGYRDVTFAPYSDLLLHDLGPELGDEKHDGAATPAEWRTPPLWGIGLLPVVNGHQRLLHDGRARGVEEAILWHGGEAEPARERFRRATREQRRQLLAFLNSL